MMYISMSRLLRNLGVILLRELCLGKTTCVLPSLQGVLIHISREDGFSCPDPLDQVAEPQSLFFVSDAICPPIVHTAFNVLGVELVVLALFIQHVKKEARVESFKAHLRKALQDP